MKVFSATTIILICFIAFWLFTWANREDGRIRDDLPGPPLTNLVLVGTNFPLAKGTPLYQKTNRTPYMIVLASDPVGPEERLQGPAFRVRMVEKPKMELWVSAKSIAKFYVPKENLIPDP